MRVDVVTIFPDYLAPLELSLVGKARREGRLDLAVHDLRGWTTDRHRTVDDTPFGGGAGMVMRPDVWGRALDEVLTGARRRVLILPTPAGEPFTQARAADLAAADQLVFGCGRYEGIDARVAEHYRATGVEVLELSLGDYVLGGGEVAALAVIEAVARLLPGVVGNPDSLVEESHGADGLLEYPVYTKPPVWAGLAVPDVLTSGHHGHVARWRRDQALARTAARRPDLLTALDPGRLDAADRAVLATHGWYVPAGGAPVRVRIRPGRAADAVALAELAAATFPLACPPHMAPADVADFVATHLGPEHMAAYLADPDRYVLQVAEAAPGAGSGTGAWAGVVARSGAGAAPAPAGRLVGYTLTVLPRTPEEDPAAEEVAAVVRARPAAELSKCYVRQEYLGTGLGGALVAAAVTAAAARAVAGEPVAELWLGTNRANRRAQRSYARRGFTVVGSRRFRVGTSLEDDVVMARALGAADAGVPTATSPADEGR